MKFRVFAIAIPLIMFAGCKTTGKVVSAPFKGAYAVGKGTAKTVGTVGGAAIDTGEFVGGAAIDTGEFVGGAAIDTGEFVGKSAYGVGKGVYYVGSVPVKITDAALDTTERMLRITSHVVDLSGKTVTVVKDIQAVQLNNELKKYKGAKNVLGVLVDIIR